MNTLNEPTIEDIKKMADEKRKMRAPSVAPKKTRQPRQKKVEVEPEPEIEELEEVSEEEEEIVEPVKTKKQTVKKQIAKPKKSKKIIVVDEDDEESEEEEEIIVKKNTKDKFKDIYESINSIKDLISSQKQVIEDAVKPKTEEPKKKPKAKPKPKAKKVVKTLDLTVSDKEVEQIVSGNKTVPQAGDAKLQAFLNAFKK